MRGSAIDVMGRERKEGGRGGKEIMKRNKKKKGKGKIGRRR